MMTSAFVLFFITHTTILFVFINYFGLVCTLFTCLLLEV